MNIRERAESRARLIFADKTENWHRLLLSNCTEDYIAGANSERKIILEEIRKIIGGSIEGAGLKLKQIVKLLDELEEKK